MREQDVLESIEKSNNEVNATMDSLRVWVRWLVSGAVIAFLATILVALGLYQFQTQNNKEALEEQARVRVERSIEFCVQENLEVQRRREFSEDQLVVIFSVFAEEPRTQEEVRESLGDELDTYNQFVNNTYRFRDCSPDCVEAHFNDSIPNCPDPEELPN